MGQGITEYKYRMAAGSALAAGVIPAAFYFV
jgi:hypothetical protein